jgi:anti-repressor protein
MNEVQKVFDYKGLQVRTVVKDGEPWFVAKDVCEILDISKHRDAVARLDDDERGSAVVDTPGGPQEMAAVNEYGLYSLVMQSRKPEAKTFKRWITHEVIPSIRKHGAYMTPETIEKTLADPDFIIGLATKLKEYQAELSAQKQYIKALEPKAEFFDAVADSKTAIEIGEAAKVLNMKIGRNNLFKILRQKGILMNNNQPYQEYIDRGYFRVIEQRYTKPDGSTHINIKTLVYQKGLEYIRKLLKSA